MYEKEEWIEKRANDIQRKQAEKLRLAEENGYVYYEGDDCSYEEAEEEWNRSFRNEEEEEE